jgi:hypothetical protein
MSIILPKIDFSKVKLNNYKTLKEVHYDTSDSNSDSDDILHVDDIRRQRVKHLEELEMKNESIDEPIVHLDLSNLQPPIYDRSEPYHNFMMKWNNYVVLSKDRHKYCCMLNLLNKLINTEYKCFAEMNRINIKSLPDPDIIVQECQLDKEFTKFFNLQPKPKNTSLELLQNLLSKINKRIVPNKNIKSTYKII